MGLSASPLLTQINVDTLQVCGSDQLYFGGRGKRPNFDLRVK
ncbi:MAG: hypothetical protein ACJAUZ_002350, partial [Flavobacteriaceae bacterium]